LLIELLDKNIVSFYFIFVCTLLAYIFLENKKYKNIYKQQK